jgi:ribosomal protein S18 acetylase RimI-like enzyme
VLYRLYAPEDFAALYAIEEACFQPPDRFSRGYMRQLVEQSNAAAWIAEEDERMCGFAVVEWSREPSGVEAYIQTLEVLPQFRGQRIGGELLRSLEMSARDAGAESIWLHVEAANGTAIRLYESGGFKLEGREEGYYGRRRDALIYAKAIHAQGSD